MKLVAGTFGRGPLLRLDAPVSFWGGIDPVTGRIVDVNHPQAGSVVSGKILAMPHGRGSSSSSSVLAESIRLGTAPAGLVMSKLDEILLVGVLVANDLYEVGFPLAVGELPWSSGAIWTLDHRGLSPVREPNEEGGLPPPDRGEGD
ncbi:MAG: DUF126 domain-containing protein [Acidimicrobiia bacterium]|nr:DUF126 domain-containing protein [Acidimicrobiia bacterium]MDH3463210.1 DUF126 domain-containing protein [Acidimicrobiia bacterium]